jgi:uridine phosphorylase
VRIGPVVSTDLFYDTAPGTEERWRDDGLLGVEMETATLFALAGRRRLRAAAVLIVTDLLFPSRRRIHPEELRDAEHRLGELAVAALAGDAP